MVFSNTPNKVHLTGVAALSVFQFLPSKRISINANSFPTERRRPDIQQQYGDDVADRIGVAGRNASSWC